MQAARYFQLIQRNARRSRTRLLATLGGCTLAALVVSICLVADDSLRAVQQRAAAQPNLIVHQRGRHCPATSVLPDTVARQIGALADVALAMPVAYLETPCQAVTDVTVVHGIDKQLFQQFRAFSIAPAALRAFLNDRTAALVGDRIAARYDWRVGQLVTMQELRGISFTVCGTYTTHGSVYDSLILVDRDFLQASLGQAGLSSFVLVRPVEHADSAALAARIDALPLPVPTQTQSEQAHMSTALAQLRDLIDLSRLVQSVVMLLLLMAMGNGVAMAMRDRTREFGVLRTLGFGRAQIAVLVLGEVVLVAGAGAALGCLVTYVLVLTGLLGTVSACGFTIAMRMSVWVWLLCVALIVSVATVSGIFPAWRAGRVDVVRTIRKDD
jgi:putative ABC transport system permease protein